ncbi:hypothetical protein PRZ48_010502 [Zasmidium cellare]|uniref:Uncharacterized protein n=1 Tax=Zasmidium cellare TaxID=395010 RepID=A0ABR0E8V1_ZASCE|nr:hypothetical protein PRZ48_010502 [Zasmidium cellare]
MSVAVQRPPSSLAGAFYDDEDAAATKNVDWGTATPINSIHEVEIVDHDFGTAITKRGTKRKSLQAAGEEIPKHQSILQLREIRQRFAVVESHPVPEIRKPEELVILCPSTDYRDLRKAAYQQYAIASSFNVCKLPKHISTSQGASLGVAYVAAALALGVCLGLRLPTIGDLEGPDILELVRRTPLGRLPRDVVPECIAIEEKERPSAGDWIVIWGGSSTSALFLSQIARLAGLKVILVLDCAKHGNRVQDTSGCICIDSHDSERATRVIRGIAGDDLRYGIDTVGKETAASLAKALRQEKGGLSHLVGLAALPKERLDGVVYHNVPVKLFHEVPEIGRAIMAWLEQALNSQTLELPRVDEVTGGLGGINAALDQMRVGNVSGRRLVVPLS